MWISPRSAKTEFVFVYVQYQNAYIQKKRLQSRYRNDGAVYKKGNTHGEHIEWLEGGGGLFAVCLYSNISFMQSFTETLCVVHLGPVCRADGRGGRVVVFLTSFFNIGRCCL